jgi:hypothetical protein
MCLGENARVFVSDFTQIHTKTCKRFMQTFAQMHLNLWPRKFLQNFKGCEITTRQAKRARRAPHTARPARRRQSIEAPVLMSQVCTRDIQSARLHRNTNSNKKTFSKKKCVEWMSAARVLQHTRHCRGRKSSSWSILSG